MRPGDAWLGLLAPHSESACLLPAGLMRDLSVAPSALEAAVTAVKGRKRVTDQVRSRRLKRLVIR